MTAKREFSVPSLFLSFAVAVGVLASARVASAQVITSLGSNLVFEGASNGRSYEIRQPLSIRAGYRFKPADLYLEYSTFHASQGTASVQVARAHNEWLAWGRRILVPRLKLAPYVAGGVGLQYDTVDTYFAAQKKTDQGKPQAVGAAAAGFIASVREGLEIQLESKVAMSSNYAPNPLLGVAVFVGWRFR